MNISGVEDMSQASASDHIKLAIAGPPGSGKSWLAVSGASETEPVFCYDFDGRKQSIAGKKNVFVKTYQDVNYPNMMPMAWTNFLSDIQAMEVAKAKNDLQYKWLVPDSMTYMCQAAMNYLLYNDRGIRREIKSGLVTTYVPKSFDAYKAEQAEINGALSRLFCLGNVVCTFHTAPEKAPEHTAEAPKFTGKLTVDPPRAIDLLALFNEQWLIKALGPDSYEVQTKPDYFFLAKTALKINATEKPNLRDIIAKHRATP